MGYGASQGSAPGAPVVRAAGFQDVQLEKGVLQRQTVGSGFLFTKRHDTTPSIMITIPPHQRQDREHLRKVVAALARHPERRERKGSEGVLGPVHEGGRLGVHRLGLCRRRDSGHLGSQGFGIE